MSLEDLINKTSTGLKMVLSISNELWQRIPSDDRERLGEAFTEYFQSTEYINHDLMILFHGIGRFQDVLGVLVLLVFLIAFLAIAGFLSVSYIIIRVSMYILYLVIRLLKYIFRLVFSKRISKDGLKSD